MAMVPQMMPYSTHSGVAWRVRGIWVPTPRAARERLPDINRLPQALTGLNCVSSAGNALSSSALLG